MASSAETEQRRVRVFLVTPVELLRCFQLLASGVKLQTPVLPSAVRLLYCEDRQENNEAIFALMLEHDSFEVSDVTSLNGRLYPIHTHLPTIRFRLDEDALNSTPSPIKWAMDSQAKEEVGVQLSHDKLNVRSFHVHPYQILRLFALLSAGQSFSMSPLPGEMTLLFSGYDTSKAVFFLMCEHPSFDAADVGIERVNGLISAVGGNISYTTLEIVGPE